MELIISLLQSKDKIGIINYDIDRQEIVSAIPLAQLEVDSVEDGVRGITYSKHDIYYATSNKVVKTDYDYKFHETIYDGFNIHQIDISNDSMGWLKDDAIMICNTGYNFVLEASACDDRIIHIGKDGMRSDFNHISSVFGTEQYNYFVYHNNWQYGIIVRNDDQVMLNNMVNPHNVYVCDERIIACNSLYNEVIIKEDLTNDEYDIDSAIEIGGYSRGMALNIQGYLFVGESKAGKPAISVIDIIDKRVIDRYQLEDLDEEDEIYDIRIWNGTDLCMTRSNV